MTQGQLFPLNKVEQNTSLGNVKIYFTRQVLRDQFCERISKEEFVSFLESVLSFLLSPTALCACTLSSFTVSKFVGYKNEEFQARIQLTGGVFVEHLPVIKSDNIRMFRKL